MRVLTAALAAAALLAGCASGVDEFHYGELEYCDGKDIAVRGIDRDRGLVFEIWCDRAPYQRTAGGYGDITQDDFGPEDYSMGWILDD